MLEYLLKIAACMVLFLLFYKVLLERESMHHFKRFFLLSAVVASLAIPKIVFVEYIEPVVVSNISTPISYETHSAVFHEQPGDMDTLNWDLILWSVYSIGLVFFGFRFFRNLFQIIRRIKSNPNLKERYSIKVLLQEQIPPHTFFTYVFLNKAKFESNAIPMEVLLHEDTHARQYHSVDVLFIEFLQVLFWFNPLVYLFKKSIKLNHEFLADKAVLNTGDDTLGYKNTLLSYLSEESSKKNQSTGIANAINYSSTRLRVFGKTFEWGSTLRHIKKRFEIMEKRTSTKAVWLRTVLVLPLCALLLYGFSETEYVEKALNSHPNELDNPIKIYIDQNQQISIQNEIVELENLTAMLTNLLETNKAERNVSQKVTVEVEGSLDAAFLELIQKEIVKSGAILESVTADIIHLEDERSEKTFRGIQFAAKDTLTIKNEHGTVLRGYTSKNKGTMPQVHSVAQFQSGASQKQLKEYNALAKKYNDMPKNNMKILAKEVNRMKYLYNLMSDEQKAAAEPFPNFPEPPAPPEVISPPKARKETSPVSPPTNPGAKTSNGQANNHGQWIVSGGVMPNSRDDAYATLPPPAPTISMHVNKESYSPELRAAINQYLNTTLEYERKVQAYREHNEGTLETLKMGFDSIMQLYKNYYTLAHKENNFVQPIPMPPSPQKPNEIVKDAIEASKQGATFYYNGKKIRSNKALRILKNNSKLSMGISRTNDEAPIVNISSDF